ncbi:MAG: RnfABCDGE type electron transport complex subunit D [Planctomycetota bacterium]|jgi:Na+-transporting NADH:ubiquinone oxidoreductase subunit B
MLRVVCALLPILLAAVYFFGWRALAVVAVSFAFGLATEYVMERKQGKPISMACLVTCMLYGLSLPPTVPFWIAAVGIVVAILFGKEVFGGFGRNFANPAIVGRAFVYVCFPGPLTAQFVPVFKTFPAGLAHWSMESFIRGAGQLPEYLHAAAGRAVDAVTQATPMWAYRELAYETRTWDLFWGNIGGVIQTQDAAAPARVLAAGSMGEGCAPLIILAAVYLLATRTANWRLMLGSLAGVAFANVLFRNVLGFDGYADVPPLPVNLLSGTTAYVLVFMVTDPVSAPKKRPAMFAYALLIGFLIVFLRWRNIFVAAASFAILLGNLVGPLLDMAADRWQRRKEVIHKGRATAAEAHQA